MTLSLDTLDYLGRGWEIAAKLCSNDSDQEAYVVILPHAPSYSKNPKFWSKRSKDILPGKPILNSPDIIQQYEIRYIKHNKKYTDTDWGWDYDYVLEDESTRIKRIFTKKLEEVELKLIEFTGYIPQLELSENFNSSLVCSPITSYLDRAEDYPHLSQETVEVL